MRTFLLSACGAAALAAVLAAATPQPAPSLEEVVRRMSQYVVAYGAQASMFVGAERYTQRVESDDGRSYPPRRLVSEFAIVKTDAGDDWIGYRDVVEVNEQAVVDRRDRLLRLLTATAIDAAQLKQIADESARYNIGPVSRNLNVPTTVLFLLQPAMASRFSFKRKATKEIEGVQTWELEFKETSRPTIIRTRQGKDVPASGQVWVAPGDGTVVRTRLELRNFADDDKEVASAPRVDTTVPPTATRSQVGGAQTSPVPAAVPGSPAERRRNESLAVVEVSYRLDRQVGAWLPLKMSETYEGALPAQGGRTFLGRATGVAEYSAFKRFETSARIVVPK